MSNDEVAEFVSKELVGQVIISSPITSHTQVSLVTLSNDYYEVITRMKRRNYKKIKH